MAWAKVCACSGCWLYWGWVVCGWGLPLKATCQLWCMCRAAGCDCGVACGRNWLMTWLSDSMIRLLVQGCRRACLHAQL